MRQDRRVGVACRGVLFDLDGVLVDSAGAVERLWRAWVWKHDLDPDRVLSVAHGWRTVDTIRTVAPHLDPEREAAELDHLEVSQTSGVVIVPGAVELLSRIPAERWAVVTSGTRALAEARLGSAGLPNPKALVTADDVANGKPDPAGYLLAADTLGVTPTDAVVVEDAPVGIQAGKAAGMRVIAVATTHTVPELSLADVCVRDLTGVALHASTPELLYLSVDASPDPKESR